MVTVCVFVFVCVCVCASARPFAIALPHARCAPCGARAAIGVPPCARRREKCVREWSPLHRVHSRMVAVSLYAFTNGPPFRDMRSRMVHRITICVRGFARPQANVARSLRGGAVGGVSFPRLL